MSLDSLRFVCKRLSLYCLHVAKSYPNSSASSFLQVSEDAFLRVVDQAEVSQNILGTHLR